MKKSSRISANSQPFETQRHSLSGYAALDLYRKEDLNSLAMKLVPGYNPDRFDAMALRLFVQKQEPSLVLYAVDKDKMEQDHYPKNKLPVKKFRLQITFRKFLQSIKRLDFTLGTDAYDISDMLVTNK